MCLLATCCSIVPCCHLLMVSRWWISYVQYVDHTPRTCRCIIPQTSVAASDLSLRATSGALCPPWHLNPSRTKHMSSPTDHWPWPPMERSTWYRRTWTFICRVEAVWDTCKTECCFVATLNNSSLTYFLRDLPFFLSPMDQPCYTPCRELLILPKQKKPLCVNWLPRLNTQSSSLCTTGSLSNSGKMRRS